MVVLFHSKTTKTNYRSKKIYILDLLLNSSCWAGCDFRCSCNSTPLQEFPTPSDCPLHDLYAGTETRMRNSRCQIKPHKPHAQELWKYQCKGRCCESPAGIAACSALPGLGAAVPWCPGWAAQPMLLGFMALLSQPCQTQVSLNSLKPTEIWCKLQKWLQYRCSKRDCVSLRPEIHELFQCFSFFSCHCLIPAVKIHLQSASLKPNVIPQHLF